MSRYITTFLLVLFAALSRMLPHPPNMAPICAMALFGGVYLDRKHAFLVPFIAMLISDYFIGFYSGIAWVYGAFVMIGLVGLWLRSHQGAGQTIGATVSGSVIFYVVTNFGVWVSSQVSYPHTLAGMLQCYNAAIPFFRNTIVGDLLYVGAMFGMYELAKRLVPALKAQPIA